MRIASRVVLVALVACSQSVAPAAQDPFASRVDQVFSAYDRKESPGCAVGVYRDGKIAYARGYGMADLSKAVPIAPGTVFDIGSTSKQFTAAGILLLAQQGKLSIDDDVRRFIPELPRYQKPITIRHLLHHTSGLRDYINLMTLAGADIAGHTTAKDALDAIVRQKALNFDPGAEYLYSNSGYFLLAQIIERASGETFRAFAEKHIFGPLGMRSSHIHDDHRMAVANRATGYARNAGGFRVDMSNWEQTGDGAVFTTVEDLLRWDQNFHDPKVGGAALVREMLATGTLNDASKLPYARGLMIGTLRGLDTVSHGGSWAGYRAELLRFPSQRFAVAVLCNVASSNPSSFARQVAQVYLEDMMTPAAPPAASQPPAATPGGTAAPEFIPPSADALRPYAGTYFSEELNTTYTIAIERGALVIRRAGAGPLVLRPIPDGGFSGGGITIRFAPGSSDRATGFELGVGRVRGIRFVRTGA